MTFDLDKVKADFARDGFAIFRDIPDRVAVQAPVTVSLFGRNLFATVYKTGAANSNSTAGFTPMFSRPACTASRQ